MLRLDAKTWERHANPWSVWTRFAILPLATAAIWSRAWIGWWSLAPVAAVIVWAVVNPGFFAPPAHTSSWASRAVLGERVWLNRRAIPIPEHHRRAIRLMFLGPVVALPTLAREV
jgi:hypothetical protein